MPLGGIRLKNLKEKMRSTAGDRITLKTSALILLRELLFLHSLLGKHGR